MGSFFMPKKSFSPEIKLLALQYLEEGYTLQKVCTMFSVNMRTLQVWRAKSTRYITIRRNRCNSTL